MRVFSALMLFSFVLPLGFAADLLPETKRAFDRYVQVTEARLGRSLNAKNFLYADLSPADKAKLRKGEVTIEPRQTLDNGKEIDVPGGLVQDWLGTLFIPNATADQVRAVLENYPAYKNLYKPEVIDSKLLNRNGNEFDIFLRLYKKQLLTVVLNANYHVKFGQLDPAHLYVNSRSTRIAEVDNPDRSMTVEQPVGHDDGFLWALNSYWRISRPTAAFMPSSKRSRCRGICRSGFSGSKDSCRSFRRIPWKRRSEERNEQLRTSYERIWGIS